MRRYNPPRRWWLHGLATYQWTSQLVGRTTLRPKAPACAQHLASALILSTSEVTEGRAFSKTHSLRCFQIIQGTSMAMDCRPFRSACGVCPFVRCHQSVRVGSLFGGCEGILAQASTSCQTCRVNGHSRSRCHTLGPDHRGGIVDGAVGRDGRVYPLSNTGPG